MKKITLYSTLIACLFIAASCTYDFPPEAPVTSGDANFTKLVTVGSSLTAGFMNGALYNDGQSHSFPAIVAAQMQMVGGGSFNQPDINAVNGYYGTTPGPSGIIILGRLYLKGTTSPAPTPKIPGDLITAYTGDKTKLNNFSAYGVTIQTAQLGATGGPASSNPYYNPYYGRFASNPGTSTLLGDAAAALTDSSFFIFWLGNDDVLGYATNGADDAGGTKPMTASTTFAGAYHAALSTMLAANENTKGAVANIPDVTSLPYFSTVAWNAITLDANTAAQLNASYVDFNNGIKAYNAGAMNGGTPPANKRDTIAFKAGSNAIVISDATLPDLTAYGIPSIRQTKNTDLVCLPAGSILGKDLGNGPKGLQDPLENMYILIPSEITTIQDRIEDFNAAIATEVGTASDRLVLVDINAVLKELKQTSITINGSTISASILPPFGGFSLDGVHPNARGNGYIANIFIEAINSKFNSTIPLCNPNNFNGNELPVP